MSTSYFLSDTGRTLYKRKGSGFYRLDHETGEWVRSGSAFAKINFEPGVEDLTLEQAKEHAKKLYANHEVTLD